MSSSVLSGPAVRMADSMALKTTGVRMSESSISPVSTCCIRWPVMVDRARLRSAAISSRVMPEVNMPKMNS